MREGKDRQSLHKSKARLRKAGWSPTSAAAEGKTIADRLWADWYRQHPPAEAKKTPPAAEPKTAGPVSKTEKKKQRKVRAEAKAAEKKKRKAASSPVVDRVPDKKGPPPAPAWSGGRGGGATATSTKEPCSRGCFSKLCSLCFWRPSDLKPQP